MDYGLFKQEFNKIVGIDLNSYKEQQMQRRILQWITRYDFSGFSGLIQSLRSDSDHLAKFLDYLTINTSHFFRDKTVFNDIADNILPAISQNNRPRIWSAGCSIGAEIYSIVMLLTELGVEANRYLATDLDENIIAKAELGSYPASQINLVPPNLLKKHFVTTDNNHYQISDSIREKVKFVQHNLLTDPYEKNFDLILCRNVFIYFTNEIQKELTSKFVDSLNNGGYFIVGSAEQIMNPNQFGLTRVSYCIYQKQ